MHFGRVLYHCLLNQVGVVQLINANRAEAVIRDIAEFAGDLQIEGERVDGQGSQLPNNGT